LAKLYVAVVFAFIAAVVIVITGLSSDARLITVFFRSIVGFVSAGLIVYIVLRILAAQDIMDFDDFIEAKDEEVLAEVEGAEPSAADDEAAEGGQPEADEAEPAETGEPAQFEPLSSEELTRMDSPQ
jgi:hypothetical protein